MGGGGGRGQHFSSYSLQAKEVCAEGGGIAPPGTAAMCQTGGEEQRWRDQAGRGGAEKVAENKVELPGSPSAVIYQHPAPFFGQQVLDRQKAPDIPVSTLELTQ